MYILWVAADVLVGLWEDRGNAGDRAAGVVVICHRLEPVAVQLPHVQIQRRLPTGELGVASPSSLFALRAVGRVEVQVRLLCLDNRLLHTIQNRVRKGDVACRPHRRVDKKAGERRGGRGEIRRQS